MLDEYVTLLQTDEDFKWYKKRLDVDAKYNHDHRGGEPAKYPCKVRSELHDDPNGPYNYYHEFIYQQKVVCDSCGHSKLVWPENDSIEISFDDADKQRVVAEMATNKCDG